MGWLKNLLGGAHRAKTFSLAGESEALPLAKEYIDRTGGIENVVREFENAGFTNKIRSWISTGPNLPINSVEIQQALGLDKLTEIARNAGIPIDRVKDLLAEHLPTAIDRVTPGGKLPQK